MSEKCVSNKRRKEQVMSTIFGDSCYSTGTFRTQSGIFSAVQAYREYVERSRGITDLPNVFIVCGKWNGEFLDLSEGVDF